MPKCVVAERSAKNGPQHRNVRRRTQGTPGAESVTPGRKDDTGSGGEEVEATAAPWISIKPIENTRARTTVCPYHRAHLHRIHEIICKLIAIITTTIATTTATRTKRSQLKPKTKTLSHRK